MWLASAKIDYSGVPGHHYVPSLGADSQESWSAPCSLGVETKHCTPKKPKTGFTLGKSRVFTGKIGFTQGRSRVFTRVFTRAVQQPGYTQGVYQGKCGMDLY